ncbi:hypothetical protein JOC36_000440 [Weissella uvarum]|nr:enterocin L50 family leaderless bacteriocin [Weissella uvarum]MBM7616907.1 hypothetical protein [Weissella uvarum]MCM0594642.1 enterocin L50 family leaderless bacteriocin [Weissella uvarum]
MGIALRLSAKYGRRYYRKIMQLLGAGWTINQIEKWLRRH